MHDGPIQRGGAAITGNPRVNDQADISAPDRFRNGAFQKWGDNQIGLEQFDSLLGYGIVDIQFDGQLMPAPGQFDKQTLRQTVETVRQKQNLQ